MTKTEEEARIAELEVKVERIMSALCELEDALGNEDFHAAMSALSSIHPSPESS